MHFYSFLSTAYIILPPTGSFNISTSRPYLYATSERLIDSTIFQATRPVTDKGGETRRSSAELRFEDRKNVETLPRFVTTTQTRIINPRNMVPCSLYLPVITIFFMSYLSPPDLPRSRRNAPSPLSASFACAFEQGDHEEGTPTLGDSCSHTRGVKRRIYVRFGVRYLPVVSNRFAVRGR